MGTSTHEFTDRLSPPKTSSSSWGLSDIPEAFDQMKSKTVEAYDSSIKVVRRNPVKSLAAAAGIGLAIGYLVKKFR